MKRRCGESGFSLVELMFAMAIFVVAIGAVAQGLVASYTLLDVQGDRVAAVNACRSLLSQMRSARDVTTVTAPCDPASATYFQCKMTTLYPNNSVVTGPTCLRSSQITLNYQNTAANPLVVTITCSWTALQGHRMTLALTSTLTDI